MPTTERQPTVEVKEGHSAANTRPRLATPAGRPPPGIEGDAPSGRARDRDGLQPGSSATTSWVEGGNAAEHTRDDDRQPGAPATAAAGGWGEEEPGGSGGLDVDAGQGQLIEGLRRTGLTRQEAAQAATQVRSALSSGSRSVSASPGRRAASRASSDPASPAARTRVALETGTALERFLESDGVEEQAAGEPPHLADGFVGLGAGPDWESVPLRAEVPAATRRPVVRPPLVFETPGSARSASGLTPNRWETPGGARSARASPPSRRGTSKAVESVAVLRKYEALLSLPGVSGMAVLLDEVVLDSAQSPTWYAIKGGKDRKGDGHRVMGIVNAHEDELFDALVPSAVNPVVKTMGPGRSGRAAAVEQVQAWLPTQALTFIDEYYPGSVLSRADGDAVDEEAAGRGPPEGGAAEGTWSRPISKAGMPPRRSEGDAEMAEGRTTDQLNALARGIEEIKESQGGRVEELKRAADAQVEQARTARQQLNMKSAPTDLKTYGFLLRPPAPYVMNVLRDYGRATDVLFGRDTYGYQLVDNLVYRAEQSYDSSEELADLHVKVEYEWVVAVAQALVTDGTGSFGLNPVGLHLMTLEEEDEVNIRYPPRKGTKVDLEKSLPVPYAQWGDVAEWGRRMRPFIDVFCRAFGGRHRRGFDDLMDLLREKSQRESEIYVIETVHQFTFEYLRGYMREAESKVRQFETHLLSIGQRKLTTANVGEFTEYYTEEDGTLPVFPPFSCGLKAREALDKFVGRLAKIAERKQLVAGVQQFAQKVQKGAKGSRATPRASGAAAADASDVRVGEAGEGGAADGGPVVLTSKDYDRARKVTPRGPNGLPYCWTCNKVGGACDRSAEGRVHDLFPELNKVAPELKLIAINCGLKPPNRWTPKPEGSARRLQAEGLRQSIDRTERAKAAAAKRKLGRASGAAADLGGLLDVVQVPLRSEAELADHHLEGELMDFKKAMNKGEVDDSWIACVMDPKGTTGKERFAYMTADIDAEVRELILTGVEGYAAQEGVFDSEASSFARSFVVNHMMHAALVRLARHGGDDIVEAAEELVTDGAAFCSVMLEGLANVTSHGARGVEPLRQELGRLGLLDPPRLSAGRARAGARGFSGLSFERTGSVYDPALKAHTFQITLNGITMTCVDHGAHLLQLNGVVRANACVLVSAGEGVALAKHRAADLGEMLEALQGRARVVKRLLGPLDDREWITQGELELRENVHDVLGDDHDMALAVFRDLSVPLFKDTTIVGIFAERGRVTDVRAVVGEDVPHLEPDDRHVVGQLYFEGHATLVLLDSARDVDGMAVDLRAPEALDAFLLRGGVTVDRQLATGQPTRELAMRDDLGRRLLVSSLQPCPVCADPGARKPAFRASGCAGALGGQLTFAREMAKAAVNYTVRAVGPTNVVRGGSAPTPLNAEVEAKGEPTDQGPPDVDDGLAEVEVHAAKESEVDGGEEEPDANEVELFAAADICTTEFTELAERIGAPAFDSLDPDEVEGDDDNGGRYGGGEVDGITEAERRAALTAVLSVVAAPENYSGDWRELVTLGHGALLFEAGSLSRAVDLYRRAWQRCFGRVIDERRLKYLEQRIPEHLVANLFHISKHGIKAEFEGRRKRRLIRPQKELVENVGVFWDKSWEQVLKGQIMLFDQTHLSHLGTVACSPILAVPKHDSYGRDTGEKRFCHNLSSRADGWSINEGINMDKHATVHLPTHKMLARTTLAQRVLFPGLPIVGCKHDVSGAFTLLDVKSEDVELFATNLNEVRSALPNLTELHESLKSLAVKSAVKIGYAVTVIVVYITGTFGSRSLPSSYGIAGSLPIGEFHRSFTPANEVYNGPFPFTSHTLVDDGALTTVDLGIRANMSTAAYLLGMFAVFGVGAMNVKKMAQDGQWSTTTSIWGLIYVLGDVLGFSVSSVRLEKVRRLFADEIWDPGRRKLTLKQIQSSVGQLRHIGQVNRQIHTAYASLHRMLHVADRGQKYVDPPGTEEEKELWWTNLHDSVEFLRVILSDPGLWYTHMLTPFTSVVTISERLAVPGEIDNMVVIGSDSTPWLLGVFNYQTRECGLIVWTEEVVEAMANALRETGIPESKLGEVLISVKELAAAVVMHTAWGRRTRGKLYVNLNDNFNSCRWVAKRFADNPFIHHLLLILGRLELRHGNDSHLIYVNTHRNEIADYSTRWVSTAEEAKRLIDHFDAWLARDMPEFIRIDIASTVLPYLVTPWSRRSLALVDEVNPVPRQLAEADGRALGPADKEMLNKLLEQQLGGTSEVDAHRVGVVVAHGDGAPAVARQVVYFHPTLDVLNMTGLSTSEAKYLAVTRNTLATLGSDNDQGTVICVSSGTSPTYCEVMASRASSEHPCLTWLHLSPSSENRQAEPRLDKLGLDTTTFDFQAIDFGEASARTWRLIAHERQELASYLGTPPELIKHARDRPALLNFLAPAHLITKDDPCWFHLNRTPGEVFTLDTSGRSTRHGRRRHRGRLERLGYAGKTAVYHLTGIAAAITSEGDMKFGSALYFDTRTDVVNEHQEHSVEVHGEKGVLRRLTKYDAWMIAGNGLIELLEWERRHDEDETNMIPEPSDDAVSAHLAAEPPTGLAAVVGEVYGGRLTAYLRAHPRRPRPAAREPIEQEQLGPATGFVPADFDAAELMTGASRERDTRASGAPAQLNPNAIEFEPHQGEEAVRGDAAEAVAGHAGHAAGVLHPHAGRRRGGGGGGLGVALTLLICLTMGLAAEAAPAPLASGRTTCQSSWVVLFILCWLATRATAGPGEQGRRVRGVNAFSGLPPMLEDMPRGDRRGQGVNGRRFYEGGPKREPPKEEPRRGYRTSRSAPFTGETHEAIEKEKKRLAASALSRSTIKSYTTAWRDWSNFLWNHYGQLHPFLTGENKREDVEKAIAYVSYLSSLGRAHSTIKKKLSGIRYHHRLHGLQDPFTDSPALTYTLKGLKKVAGASRGKMPATKDLLEHVNDRLNTGSVMLACLSAAVQLAFFILLRSSEYCVIPLNRDGAFDKDSTLLDGDVMLICRGRMAPWDEVEEEDYPFVTEVVISIKKSKTDQNRVGVTRSAERTGERLCAVEAMLRFIKLRLEYGVNNDDEKPFFRWGSDHTQHLRRDSVSKALKSSAAMLGQHVHEYASHSLRIGGATALIHSGASPEAVRRFGRWKSDTWQQYSWSTRGLLSGLSTLMAKSEYTLEMSTQQFMAARRTAGRELDQPRDEQGITRIGDWTAEPSVDPIALEYDKLMVEYKYLVGLEFYDAEDDARFRVTDLSEEMLAVTLSDDGAAEVSRCYVLAHYYDLDTGTEYYTTAKEVGVWVEETRVAEATGRQRATVARGQRSPPPPARDSPAGEARSTARSLRQRARVHYSE